MVEIAYILLTESELLHPFSITLSKQELKPEHIYYESESTRYYFSTMSNRYEYTL